MVAKSSFILPEKKLHSYNPSSIREAIVTKNVHSVGEGVVEIFYINKLLPGGFPSANGL